MGIPPVCEQLKQDQRLILLPSVDPPEYQSVSCVLCTSSSIISLGTRCFVWDVPFSCLSFDVVFPVLTPQCSWYIINIKWNAFSVKESENIILPVRSVLLATVLKVNYVSRGQNPKVISDTSLSEKLQQIYSHSLKLNWCVMLTRKCLSLMHCLFTEVWSYKKILTWTMGNYFEKNIAT